MAALEDPTSIGGVDIPNRMYRAPLLECAGTDDSTPDQLIAALEPAAEAGAGLIFQGATIIRGEGGCAAPQMTRVHDPDFVSTLEPVPDAIHRHGSKIFIQLDHGGLRSLETWHAQYREQHPELTQLAVSTPPWPLRVLDQLGFVSLNPHILSTEAVYALARDFASAAEAAIQAGYDGIHLAGANMGIIQQFLSPLYNHRSDEFGGDVTDRAHFLAVVHDQIRDRIGDVPLVTKVPAETAAPPLIQPTLSQSATVTIAEELEEIGYDAVVPVECSPFWDLSIIRGAYPERAFDDPAFQAGYHAAFGSRVRAGIVKALTRLEARYYDRQPVWNQGLCRLVRQAVEIPVLCEGGIRTREQIDSLLDEPAQAADFVGMARPFYAEPKLPALLLDQSTARVACESCNNCTVPQVTGASGVCRTPHVLERRGRRERRGAYERE